MFYIRNDTYERGTFSVKGNTIEIVPVEEERIYRIKLLGDIIQKIEILELVSRRVTSEPQQVTIFPAKHFVVPPETMKQALVSIEKELADRLSALRAQGKILEADRLERRTRFDMSMMREVGYTNGIENYSRHMTSRVPGEAPDTLIDYFPSDFLTIIDESHVTVPQIRGMNEGDRARKEVLIDHGFRLPSALDNRPLKFNEFDRKTPQKLFLSATPGPYEREKSKRIVEQIIRPTGLVDPELLVRPIAGQVDD